MLSWEERADDQGAGKARQPHRAEHGLPLGQGGQGRSPRRVVKPVSRKLCLFKPARFSGSVEAPHLTAFETKSGHQCLRHLSADFDCRIRFVSGLLHRLYGRSFWVQAAYQTLAVDPLEWGAVTVTTQPNALSAMRDICHERVPMLRTERGEVRT
jgi:hypothetical protein